jgi:ABC-type uncharacterized transport system auxiliary subunit
MLDGNDTNRIVKLERAILRLLCQSTGSDRIQRGDVRSLANYTWNDPEHRIVFEALGKVRANDARALREQLPAAATRLGFPDVDWTNYFGPLELGQTDMDDLLRQLNATVAKRP